MQKNRNALINCKFKYEEFANYINEKLNLKCKVKKYTHRSDRYKNGYCEMYSVYSELNALFTEERNRWYMDGKKIIPNDFRFSPTSMNVMYLGDGHLLKKKSFRCVNLCTNAFEKSNIEMVILKKLHNVGIDAYINKNNVIRMNTSNSIKFLKYIGECPVECYRYKWDI